MSKVTIRDVARVAGVGIGTVSRVLNNNENVSDKTRQQVLNVIEELGFVPNAAARQLPRKTRYQPIGVLTRTFHEYYSFAERLRGVQKALRPYGNQYELALYNTYSTQNYGDRLLSIIDNSAMSGLLVIDFDLTQEQKNTLRQSSVPFVGLNHVQNADWPCVGTDNEAGGYLATRYLLDLGHRRIAYLGDELIDSYGFNTSEGRYSGYDRALREAGIEPDPALMVTGEMGYEQAVKMATRLLREHPHPTAIFAMSDTQALGVLAAVREYGLRVPQDISVMGYDNLGVSYHVGLTTVTQHLELSGEVAMTYLLDMIHHNAPERVPVLPPLQVIERQTTAPPPERGRLR